MLEKRPKLKKFLKYTFSFLKWGLVVFGFVAIISSINLLNDSVTKLSKDINIIKKENKELKARISGIHEITKRISSSTSSSLKTCSPDDMEILSEFSYLSEKKDKNYSVYVYKERKGRCYFTKLLGYDGGSFVYKINNFEIEVVYKPISGDDKTELDRVEEIVVVRSNEGHVIGSYMIIIKGQSDLLFNEQDLKNIAEKVLKIDGVL